MIMFNSKKAAAAAAAASATVCVKRAAAVGGGLNLCPDLLRYINIYIVYIRVL